MISRLLSALYVAALFLCAGSASARTSSDAAFKQIDSIVKALSEISDLTERHAVPYGRMDKNQLREFLSKRMEKTLRPEEIRADELALKMFGFVPQNFDLRKSTMDLLTEQAAAFYDYDEKRLFLLDDSSVSSETVTLAHELSHALADQHFNLRDFMDDKPNSDDENLAHAAVVEGQASWLMIAYSLKQAGQDPVPTDEMLRSITDPGSASSADFPVLADAPLYIQRSLLFPYTNGTAFFQSVYQRLGKQAFGEVFRNPPSDTAQILHVDRYFAHQAETQPGLPKLKGANDKSEVTEGSVGEFDHRMLLEQYAQSPGIVELASHLAGGSFRIDRFGRDHRPVLRYVSEWDSPESAATFFAQYPKILAGKWKHYDPTRTTPTILTGTGDHGWFVTRLSGKTVSSVEGLSNGSEWRRLSAGQ